MVGSGVSAKTKKRVSANNKPHFAAPPGVDKIMQYYNKTGSIASSGIDSLFLVAHTDVGGRHSRLAEENRRIHGRVAVSQSIH